jgi:ABC-type histidine transport system ATPase subunit
MADPTPALVVEDMHKRFGDLEVLKGVSLEAHEGDVIAILGSSGSGKSTMLRCINLLETPDTGRVYVAGELIKMKPTRDGHATPEDHKQVDRIRSELGMVFQSFNLWSHMTVLQNIIEAPIHVLKVPRVEAVARAEALLVKVGIADKRDHYPSHLSGGQQQRAAIARALAMEPKVMLFDEPTRPSIPSWWARCCGHASAGRRGDHHAGGHPRDELRARGVVADHIPAQGPHRGKGPAEGGLQQPEVGSLPPVPRRQPVGRSHAALTARMATENAGTARHWIVAIIAAAIVLAALLVFGGRKDEPPAAPASSEQTTP